MKIIVLLGSVFLFTLTALAAMPPDVAQLWQQNNYTGALARVDALLQANPGDTELTKLRAEIAAEIPAASAPATAGSIPDSQINKFNNYVAGGNIAEANKLADALASFYPDDPRLPGLKAKLNTPATSQPSSPEASVPVVPAQPTGMDRVAYNATMLLVQQAQQATDPDTRKATLERFLRESAPLTKKYPGMMQLWQTRAAVALQLDDVRTGAEAGANLLKLGAADSQDPALQQLLAQLQLKGWLDPDKVNAIIAGKKTADEQAVKILKDEKLKQKRILALKKIEGSWAGGLINITIDNQGDANIDFTKPITFIRKSNLSDGENKVVISGIGKIKFLPFEEFNQLFGCQFYLNSYTDNRGCILYNNACFADGLDVHQIGSKVWKTQNVILITFTKAEGQFSFEHLTITPFTASLEDYQTNAGETGLNQVIGMSFKSNELMVERDGVSGQFYDLSY